MLETQILKPPPRSTESETPGVGLSNLYFSKLSRLILMHTKDWELQFYERNKLIEHVVSDK